MEYEPRPHQAALQEKLRRFSVLVCHRRFGKTVLAVNELMDDSLECKKPEPRHAYLAPFRKQAKRVAWDYLKRFTAHLPERTVHEGELRIDLWGGRRIFVDGADNPDALRGLYLDGVVLDEFGQMQPTLWREVVRPALSDREGSALFIGTPKGRNAFHDLYRDAAAKMAAGDADWFAALHRASETGVIPPLELEAARRDMDADEFEQEFECSFAAGIVGAYYAKLLAEAEREKRIGAVPWEPALPVHTAWDLGIGDSTVIWFVQLVGRELRWIDYHEEAGVGLDHYARALGAKPYVYGEHLLPHDAAARELGTGRTRIEMLASLGIRGRIVPRHAVDDGIQDVGIDVGTQGAIFSNWFAVQSLLRAKQFGIADNGTGNQYHAHVEPVGLEAVAVRAGGNEGLFTLDLSAGQGSFGTGVMLPYGVERNVFLVQRNDGGRPVADASGNTTNRFL